VIFSSCGKKRKTVIDNGPVRIETNESIFKYTFKARFPKERTVSIKNLLSTKLDQPEILENRSVNNSVRLLNQTSFTLKLRPGALEISIRKNNRTEQEIEDIQNLGKSIQRILLNP
jgi:hypothetical protein